MPSQLFSRLKLIAVFMLLILLTAVSATLVLANDSRATVDVEVFNFGFNSNDVTIDVGDTIQWMNTDGSHNVQSTDGTTFRCGPEGCDQTGGDGDAGTAPWTTSFTFETAGVYDYVCQIHGSMRGTITVMEPSTVTAVAVSQADVGADNSLAVTAMATMLMSAVACLVWRRRAN